MENYFKKKLTLQSIERRINRGIEISDNEREEFRVLYKEIRAFEKENDYLSYSVDKIKMSESERIDCLSIIQSYYNLVEHRDRITPSIVEQLIRTATIAFEDGINLDKIEQVIKSKIDYKAKLRLNDTLLELIIIEKGFSQLSSKVFESIYKIRNELTAQGIYSPKEEIDFNQSRYTYSTIVLITQKGKLKSPLSKQQLGRYALRKEDDSLYLRTFERKSSRHGVMFVLHDDFERFYLSFCAYKGIENTIDFEKLKANPNHCYLYNEVQNKSIDFEDGLTTVVKKL